MPQKRGKLEIDEKTRQELLARREAVWAAEWLAKRGLTGKVGDPLPDLMSSRAVDWINDNLDEFEEIVRSCKYALAMERTERRTRE